MKMMTKNQEDCFSELIYAKLAGSNLHSEALDAQFKDFGFRPGDVRGAEADVDICEAIYEIVNQKTVA